MNYIHRGINTMIGGGIIGIAPFAMGFIVTGCIAPIMGYDVIDESGVVYYKGREIPRWDGYYDEYNEISEDGYPLNEYNKEVIRKDQNIVRAIGGFLAPFGALPWFCVFTLPLGTFIAGIGGLSQDMVQLK